MRRLLIYGAGGQGKEALRTARAVQRESFRWGEILFVDDEVKETQIHGVPVITFETYLTMAEDGDEFTIADGEPYIQKRLAEKLRTHGCRLATLIHPTFRPSPYQTIGEGVYISENVTISDYTIIGDCVLINSNVVIADEDVIGDFVTISPGVLLSGAVKVGEGTYLAPGVITREELSIGKNCIVGMGSLVTKSIPDNSVAFGAPCRVVRENKDGVVFHP